MKSIDKSSIVLNIKDGEFFVVLVDADELESITLLGGFASAFLTIVLKNKK